MRRFLAVLSGLLTIYAASAAIGIGGRAALHVPPGSYPPFWLLLLAMLCAPAAGVVIAALVRGPEGWISAVVPVALWLLLFIVQGTGMYGPVEFLVLLAAVALGVTLPVRWSRRRARSRAPVIAA